MLEHTFIIDAQLTSIMRTDGDENLLSKEQIKENLKDLLLGVGIFDDVVISDLKIFERDIEDVKDVKEEREGG